MGGNQKVNAMMFMNPTYTSDWDLVRKDGGSVIKSASTGQVLQKNINTWCELTGLSPTITIHFRDRSFNVHKFPLVTRSGYFKRMLLKTKELRIPQSCPGGLATFENVMNFCYGVTVLIDATNVAELRCMAEFLEMNEHYGKGNLCERTDLYMSQVILQSWQDTMVVLLHTQRLLPYAEDLRIVDRCIEVLAFMACMEMVDPLERISRPGMSVESQLWSDISTSARISTSPDWWMDDLLRLPCGMFERVIDAIRKQGMQEKYVSQAIVKFVDRWMFTNSTAEWDKVPKFRNPAEDSPLKPSAWHIQPCSNQYNLVEAVVRLLPVKGDAVPISFLFSLLRCALACNSSAECLQQLESRIASQLELATMADLLYLFKNTEASCISGREVSCMRRIVTSFMNQQTSLSDGIEMPGDVPAEEGPENSYCQYAVSAVAKVWDEFMAEVARDGGLSPEKFLELVEVIPLYARATHDHLYEAVHVYLKSHPQLLGEDRQMVCGILSCQKLSQEMCMHAVQDELMPLRMVVQAMFMQQLQTRNALSSNLQLPLGGSMRFDSLPSLSREPSFRRNSLPPQLHSDSFRSPREAFRAKRGVEPFRIDDPADEAVSMGSILKRDVAYRQASMLKAEYRATEMRLQNLEEELAVMRSKIEGTPVHVKGGFENLRREDSESPADNIFRKSCDVNVGQGAPLPTVPESEYNSAEEEEGTPVQQVKVSSKSGRGLLSRAFRFFALGSFRRKKGDVYSKAHSLCSGRIDWPVEDNSNSKPKSSRLSMNGNERIVAESNLGATPRRRHLRSHSIA
ncbi:hypothetical protein R1sor_012240 [Riccia sorocarpa]|uniref:BTB/POZ domain-containing protein n=1 Tax=Riccia sorocarpa TaxID=122646 RepID=A0ABD3I9E5_9MARC